VDGGWENLTCSNTLVLLSMHNTRSSWMHPLNNPEYRDRTLGSTCTCTCICTCSSYLKTHPQKGLNCNFNSHPADINSLYEHHRQLYMSFREQRMAYQMSELRAALDNRNEKIYYDISVHQDSIAKGRVNSTPCKGYGE
jgi:hypothetical protein